MSRKTRTLTCNNFHCLPLMINTISSLNAFLASAQKHFFKVKKNKVISEIIFINFKFIEVA